MDRYDKIRIISNVTWVAGILTFAWLLGAVGLPVRIQWPAIALFAILFYKWIWL